ncbi:MAG TPA: hypothetical protein V6D11_32460 [Waterburya sp.]
MIESGLSDIALFGREHECLCDRTSSIPTAIASSPHHNRIATHLTVANCDRSSYNLHNY